MRGGWVLDIFWIKWIVEFLLKLSDLEIDSESALEIIKLNRLKFDLDHFLKSANENSLCDLAKFLAV